MSFQSGVIRRGQSNDHQGARSRSRDTLISSVRNLSQPNPFKQHLQGFNYSRQPTIQPPLPRQNYSSAHFDSRTTQQWPPAYQHIAHPNGGPSQMVEANGSLYSDNQYDDHSNGYATPRADTSSDYPIRGTEEFRKQEEAKIRDSAQALSARNSVGRSWQAQAISPSVHASLKQPTSTPVPKSILNNGNAPTHRPGSALSKPVSAQSSGTLDEVENISSDDGTEIRSGAEEQVPVEVNRKRRRCEGMLDRDGNSVVISSNPHGKIKNAGTVKAQNKADSLRLTGISNLESRMPDSRPHSAASEHIFDNSPNTNNLTKGSITDTLLENFPGKKARTVLQGYLRGCNGRKSYPDIFSPDQSLYMMFYEEKFIVGPIDQMDNVADVLLVFVAASIRKIEYGTAVKDAKSSHYLFITTTEAPDFTEKGLVTRNIDTDEITEYRFIVKEEPRNGDSVYRRYLTAVAQTTKFEIRAGASGMSPSVNIEIDIDTVRRSIWPNDTARQSRRTSFQPPQPPPELKSNTADSPLCIDSETEEDPKPPPIPRDDTSPGDMIDAPGVRKTATRSTRRQTRNSQSCDVTSLEAKNTVFDIQYVPSAELFFYPYSGDHKSCVTIRGADMLRLKEGEYLNDSIIECYLRHLFLDKLSDKQRDSVHIFNSFFFRTLQDGSTKTWNAEESYARVRKWTKSVDIFQKEFLVIPINEHAHWYVAIIHNPAAVLKENVTRIKPMPKIRKSARLTGEIDPDQLSMTAFLNPSSDIQSNPKSSQSFPGTGNKVGRAAKPKQKVQEHTERYSPKKSAITPAPSSNLATSKTNQTPIHDILQLSDDGNTEMLGAHESNLEGTHHNEAIDVDDRQLTPDLPKPTTISDSSDILHILDETPTSESYAHPTANKTSEEAGQSINLAQSEPQGRMTTPEEALPRPDEIIETVEVTESVPDPQQTPEQTEECAVMLFDSLGSTHRAAQNKIIRYLVLEAKDKKGIEGFGSSCTAKDAKAPGQNNHSDCGVFLLRYVEQMLRAKSPPSIVEKVLRGEDTAPDFSKPLTRKHIFDTMVKIQAAATKAFETGLLQSNNKH